MPWHSLCCWASSALSVHGRTMTELVGMMVFRKETTPAHCVRDSSQALLVPFFSREALALRNSSTALLGLAWRASLGSSHSSRAMCPHQGSTSHQVQVSGLLLQNKFLNFTAPRLQHLIYRDFLNADISCQQQLSLCQVVPKGRECQTHCSGADRGSLWGASAICSAGPPE